MEVVLPSVAWGNVAWFASYVQADRVIIDVHENYVKQSCRNRYEILTAQGRMGLTIPVVGQKGEKVPVQDLRVHDNSWQILHWRSLVAAYNSSPFFLYYQDELESLYRDEYDKLIDFNTSALDFLLRSLQMDSKHEYSDAYSGNHLNSKLTEFKPCNRPLDHPKYLQVFSDRIEFESNLSVLDLLFNKGPEATAILQQSAVY